MAFESRLPHAFCVATAWSLGDRASLSFSQKKILTQHFEEAKVPRILLPSPLIPCSGNGRVL